MGNASASSSGSHPSNFVATDDLLNGNSAIRTDNPYVQSGHAGKILRVSVLESGENATLKKRLAETETKLVWACMKHDTTERRLHEFRVWNKMFHLDMVRIGAVLKPPPDYEDTERPRKKSENSTFDGTKEPSEPQLVFWSSITLDGDITGGTGASGARVGGAGADCAEAGGAGVSGAGPTALEITGCTYITFMKWEPHPFKGTKGAMTKEFCPRSVLQRLEQELYNLKVKGSDIDGYTNRFHELALLCPKMVEPEQVKVEQYIHGLSKNIRGDVTSSRPAGIDEAVRMAYQLLGQIIQDKTDEVSKGENRKGEGDCGGHVCPKCKNKKHGGIVRNMGHRKRNCPKLKKNGQGGNNLGVVYKLRVVDAQQDPKVVTELGSFDIIIGMDWLSRYDAAIMCGEKKVRIPLEGMKIYVGNKMHKAFPLEEVPTASVEGCHYQKKTLRLSVILVQTMHSSPKTQFRSVFGISQGFSFYHSLRLLRVFRIQQYLQHEHYAMWEVIKFGDSYVVPANTTDTTGGDKSGRTLTLTAEDMQRKKNDVKARTTILLSLPDEHQLRFSKYKTAREIWAAILKTFGGNKATKKTKKNLLKQQYGNFNAEGSETLEQTFKKLQVIVGQL
nr:hypothetical protein [Tanacetum cinerariifolium]